MRVGSRRKARDPKVHRNKGLRAMEQGGVWMGQYEMESIQES